MFCEKTRRTPGYTRTDKLFPYTTHFRSDGAAAIAGSLLAHYIAVVSPQSFSIDETILVLAMIILGGTGNLFGAVVGAFILVLLPEVLKFLDLPVGTADLMRNAFYGLMLIVILRFRPEGLFPERYRYTLPAGAQSAGAQSAGAQSAGGTFQLAPLANAGDRAVTLAGADLHKNFGGIVAANGVDIEVRAGQVTGLDRKSTRLNSSH